MANFGQIFKNDNMEKEKPLHPKWITNWIHYSKLKRNKYQYCDAKTREEIENLADIIRADGQVLQNIVVRKIDADTYEIIAGHKRVLACEILVEEGLEQYAFLPCLVTDRNDIRMRFSVISTNTRHDKTPYEIMHEIEEAAYLLENYPEEFPDVPRGGRLVERLAKQLHMNRSVISDYQNISHNLGDMGMEAFEKGELGKSAATALAGLPKEEQDSLINGGVIKYKEIKEHKEKLKNADNSDNVNVPNFGTGDKEKAMESLNRRNKGVQSSPSTPVFDKKKTVQKDLGNLPIMKNMQQRESFVEGYKSWPVWCTNTLTEETFYRMDLPDGSAIVVKSYPYQIGWKNEETEGRIFYLIKKDTKHFADAVSNMTTLKEHLKDIQN